MFRIVRFSTSLMAACLLLACGYFDDDPPYPPIDKEKLIGCWVATNSGGRGRACDEQCYSTSNLYYGRINDDTLFGASFVEFGGRYSVKGNTITLLVQVGNNVEKPDSTIKKLNDPYTIKGDTLYSITRNGMNFNPFIRADSTNTCGPHWQIFPEPEGWDLN